MSSFDILDIADYFFKSFSNRLFAILPVTPSIDTAFLGNIRQYLGWLNWFFPIGDCVNFCNGILVALGVYYTGKVILKRIGII